MTHSACLPGTAAFLLQMVKTAVALKAAWLLRLHKKNRLASGAWPCKAFYERHWHRHALITAANLQGLQSDREFAETFARSRWRQYRWAASRIRIELMKKGVSKEDAEHALNEIFGDERTVRLHNDTIDESDLEGALGYNFSVLAVPAWNVNHHGIAGCRRGQMAFAAAMLSCMYWIMHSRTNSSL